MVKIYNNIIKRFRNVSSLLTLTLLSVLFIGWGQVGHNKISYNTKLSITNQLSFFPAWADSLSLHASDADNRKSKDPTEGPKHFIDIDNYSEFLNTGYIPHDYDSMVANYGYNTVIDNGILPWAILNTADSLKEAFKKNDMHKAMLIASDLGHYIADAHMPLHITRNYNGQLTGQTGIHSRYETTMIGKFQNQIIYSGDNLKYIENISDYVFEMINENYKYVDSVLAADAAAKSYAGNNTSDVYYNKFWELTKDFTIKLFKSASNKIACVIYTEWINAQDNVSRVESKQKSLPTDFILNQNYPNPFNPSTKISWQSPVAGHQTLKIYNLLGNEVATLVNEFKEAGKYEISFDASNLPAGRQGLSSGVYIYKLQVGSFVSTKKMLLLK